MQIKDLNDKQIVALREDVVLNSLFTRDYTNRFGISPNDVQDFFDGYLEYLFEIAEEDGCPIDEVINRYDNAENLIVWRYCLSE